VTVYACKWDTSGHNASSLGVKDVKVVDLYQYQRECPQDAGAPDCLARRS
jgi:hypothetical protein